MKQASEEAVLRHFERSEVWGEGSAYEHPVQRERAEVIEAALPEGTSTLLDVGCGDGTVTNLLAERFEVTGVDTSHAALEHVRAPTKVASAAKLPFEDRAFDAVVMSEVLEHLDERTYQAARSEAARVAAKTIVITVPNRELLRDSAVRCPRCRTLFSPWQHQRSFNPRRLAALFPGFRLEHHEEIGPDKPRVSRAEAWLRSSFTRPKELWFPALCPKCGLVGEGSPPVRKPGRPAPASGARKYVAIARDVGGRSARRALRPRARPVWLLGRFERR